VTLKHLLLSPKSLLRRSRKLRLLSLKRSIRLVKRYLGASKRRKILASALAILILITSLQLSFLFNPKEVRADSLLKFDEGYGTTVNDESGNVAGTITNAVWKTDDLCLDKMCLYFDGTGDFISFGDDPDMDFAGSTNFTLEGWFRTPDITSGQRTIIAKYNGATGTDGGYKVYMDSNGYLIFGIDNDQTSFPSDSASTTPASFDDNKWHHFAAVKSGTTSITIYVDGIAYQTDSAITSATLANSDTLYIGIDGDGSSNGFSGFVDEVKIYTSSARTQAEVFADVLGATKNRGTSAEFGDNKRFLSDGLVGYWKMDDAGVDAEGEISTDSSGNGNSGTLFGDNGVGDNGTGMNCTAGGKFGTGCDFDGSDDYVQIPDSSSLDVDTFATVSVWIRIDTTPTGTNRIYTKISSSDSGIGLSIDSSSKAVAFYKGGISAAQIVTSVTTVSLNTWYHIAATFDGNSSFKIFINGVEEDSEVQTGTNIGINTQSAFIGTRETLVNFFNGQIDDVRVYRRAFTSAEISALYNWAPGPVGYWSMDEASWINDCATDSVFDRSGNGNNGDACPASTGPTGGAVGKFGKAGDFDGTDDYVDLGDDLMTTASSYTISAWVKIDDTTTHAVIETQGTPIGDGNKISMDIVGGDELQFFAKDTSQSVGFQVQTTNNLITTGVWHHVVIKMDSSSGNTIYIDGSQVSSGNLNYISGNSSTTFSFSSLSGTQTTELGRNFYSGSYRDYINGQIDEVKIFNYARSQTQIIEDMNAGHPAPGSPIGSALGHWKFDEGYGDTANDSGTGGNNGNLAGGTSCPQASDSACPTWTNSGKFGKALDFDNAATTDDYVDSGDINALDGTTEFTLSAWVNFNNLTNNATVLGKRGDSDNQIQLGVGAPGDGGGSDDAYLVVENNAPGVDSFGYTNTNLISTGSWNHWVMVYNGNGSSNSDKVKFYFNGVAQSLSFTGTIPATTDSNTASFIIGAVTATAGNMDGVLDEVKIYNAALTADQVKLDFNQGMQAVWGATSTDSSGNATFSSQNEYCPPGQGSTCTSPVGEWKFDEKTGTSANDTSGNGNSGSFGGSPTWSHAGECQKGACLDSNGSTDYVNMGDPSSGILDFGTGDFSFGFWMKPSAVASESDLLAKRTESTIDVSVAYTTANKIRFQVWNTSYQVDLYSNGTVPLNQWHYVTAIRAGTTQYIYIDGVLDNSGTGTIKDVSSSANFFLGRNPFTANRFYDGLMDDVKIYNYARTQSQIAWEYNQGGPVGWWAFDECSGSVANDRSGKGNNGTITIGATGSNTSAGTCGGSSGQAWFHGATGKRNASLDFDGTDDYINAGDITVLNSASAFTVTVWMNQDVLNQEDWIFSKSVDSNTRLGIVTWSDGTMYFEPDGATNRGRLFNYSTIISAGQWHHIAMVFDGSQSGNANRLKAYVDGKQQTLDFQGTIPATTPNTSGNPVTFGENLDATDFYSGKLDEVKIFNYALTPQQIRDVYNSGAVRYGPDSGSP